jgi:hypothetical protein
MRQIDRELRLGGVAEMAPFRRPEGVARYAEGLRLAGLASELTTTRRLAADVAG